MAPERDARRRLVARARGDLRHRLRVETADLHRAVEDAVDLPGSVRSRADYVALLARLHLFHAAVERRLADPRWRGGWAGVGIDLRRHERSPLLARDLQRLGAAVPQLSSSETPQLPELDRFGHALGCLYVLEGSSLGGRVLGPALRQVLGDIPTAFFDSEGREHPSPWRALQDGLRRYEGSGTADPDDALSGARSTFVAFGRQVATGRPETVTAP